jgi:hypothetical protein
MTKNEIIEKTLRDMELTPPKRETPFSDEPDDEEFVVSVLQDSLPADLDIRTCNDFRHLNVECCETCHNFYPHYEMSLVDLPGGGKAWVCDTVKWAIYPDQYRQPGECLTGS